MTDGTTADARLERLLYVIPAAHDQRGALLTELATNLDTTTQRIVQDIEQVTHRAYYHPGGWPDDISILLESDRVRVLHARGLERPLRLNSRETLCLALALRGGSSAAHLPDASRRGALLRRAERHLGAGSWSEGATTPVHTEDSAPDPTGIRETLLSAARDRTPCAIVYAKVGGDDVDARVIHPYVLAMAEGRWYVVGWCAVKEGMRVFRVDRILEAAGCEGSFAVPEGFDPADYLEASRVYRADTDMEVRVRYSPRVARWVRELAANGSSGWEEESDGSVVIQHQVADPHWVVGHALEYGADAEILAPPEMRALVREVVAGMMG